RDSALLSRIPLAAVCRGSARPAAPAASLTERARRPERAVYRHPRWARRAGAWPAQSGERRIPRPPAADPAVQAHRLRQTSPAGRFHQPRLRRGAGTPVPRTSVLRRALITSTGTQAGERPARRCRIGRGAVESDGSSTLLPRAAYLVQFLARGK